MSADRPGIAERLKALLIRSSAWERLGLNVALTCAFILLVDRLSNLFLGLRPYDTIIYLAGVFGLAVCTGLSGGLVACLMLVAYVWTIYRFPHLSAVVRNPAYLRVATIGTFTLYTPFAVIGGATHHVVAASKRLVRKARDETDRERQKRRAADAEHVARLEALNSSLEERVAERTRELEIANRELLGFTHSVSHDLRAPLRSIVSNSRIVLGEAEGILPDHLVDRLVRLEQSALKLSKQIDCLLQYARIGQAEMERQGVDVSDLAAKIAEQLKVAQPGSIEIEAGLTVEGDPQMVELVLQNLLENAWKYVAPGDQPCVEVGQSQGALFVKDHGIGFDMVYAERIWAPFERLHRDDQYDGTGIGLANCRRIIERHGGRIWAESSPGQGAAFFFDFGVPSRAAQVEKVLDASLR